MRVTRHHLGEDLSKTLIEGFGQSRGGFRGQICAWAEYRDCLLNWKKKKRGKKCRQTK